MPDMELSCRQKTVSCIEELIRIAESEDDIVMLPAYETLNVLRLALYLLKRKEPVMPVLVPKGHGAGVGYDCGACGTELIVLRGTGDMKIVHEQVRFCRMCGRAVKWE